MKLPVFKLIVDIDTEGMDFVGLVDYPAHGKNWITMSKAPVKVERRIAFNEERQMVTGVAIATNLLIYRRDPDGFEYNVYFSKEDTMAIMKMFAKRGYHNNVNLMHDSSKKVRDAALVESYFINDEKSNIPKGFEDQNLQPGSLIFTYWIESKETWDFVKKSGAGFSIEGWFREMPVKFLKNSKNKKQSKMKKSLMERLFGSKKPEKVEFDKAKKDEYATATTADGETVYWDGDLVEGNSLFIVPADGNDPVLAEPETTYDIEVDGVAYSVTTAEAGVIASVTESGGEEETEEMEQVVEAMASEYRAKFTTQEAQMQEMAKTIDEQNEVIERLSEKVGLKAVVAKSTSAGWREIKNKNKK